MDATRFDTLAKTLSAPGTRRGALAALLAGALGLLGLAESAAGRRKPRHRQEQQRQQRRRHEARANAKKRRTATAEGPCGDGRAKANECEKDKDCCTGLCKKAKGRCRCQKLGKGCKEDRNCCANFGQPMSCQSGSCQMVSQEPAPLSPPPPPAAPPSPPPPPGPGCTPVDPCAGQCGTVQPNNCGQMIACPACAPAISAFTAIPATIDRGATPPQTSTLAWSTSNATTCVIDNGVGIVACNGNIDVGPDTTTSYTLSATGPGGGPVTAQTTVTAQPPYCHTITAPRGVCSTGNSEFCLPVPIDATNSDHAKAACEACYGTCFKDLGCDGAITANAWQGPSDAGNLGFKYVDTTSTSAGEIVRGVGATLTCQGTGGSRWAP